MPRVTLLSPLLVAGVLLAGSSAAFADVCDAIDCDCENIEAGILNRGWVPTCEDRERAIITECRQTDGAILGACDPVAHGPAAWPLGERRDDPPPGMESALTVAVAMAESNPDSRRMRLINEDIILDKLEPYEPWIENAAVFNRAARARGATQWASDVAVEAVAEFPQRCSPGTVPAQTAGRLLEAQRAIAESTPVPLESLRQSVERVERLNKLGLGIDELTTQGGFIPTEKSVFGEVGAFYDSIFKWIKTADSGAAYLGGDTTRASDFVDDSLSHVPKNVSLAADGPVGVFFRDLMSWNVDLFDASTDGLDFVADSIDAGCFVDQERYERVHDDLERLGRDGPWTEETFVDSMKKMITGIPGVGKIANFIWPAGGG